MIKKVIHIADIHIPNSEEARPFSKMLERFLVELNEEVKNNNRDEVRIVIAGDIFEQKNKSSKEADDMFHYMLNYLNVIAHTIIIAGNHDMLENNLNRTDAMTPTFNIANVYENITYLDKELQYKSGKIIDDNVIWVLYSMFDKFKCPDIKGIKEAYPNHRIIGLYHGSINGAVTDIGQQMDNGIDTNIFDECDCVMAGHIHKHQELKRNGVPIVYAGSLFQKDMGENITGHGFVVWDLENMTYKLHEVTNDYRMYKFRITDYEDITEDREKLINY